MASKKATGQQKKIMGVVAGGLFKPASGLSGDLESNSNATEHLTVLKFPHTTKTALCGPPAFVIHNYVNLNIGLTLTIHQSIAYFIQWPIVGAAIGLIYKPA